MNARWWQFLLVGAVLATGVLALPLGLPRYAGYLVVGASAVVAMGIGLRRNRPATTRPWVLLVAGNGAWLVGDSAYTWHAQVPAVPVPVPAWTYLLYLAAYLLLTAGLLTLARGRTRNRSSTARIDTVVLTVGIGLASWVYLVAPALAADDALALDRVIAVAYPLCNLVVVATAIWLVTSPGLWNAASRLLVSSVTVLLVTNGLLQRVLLDPSLAPIERYLDVGWLLAFVLAGAAALHPTMRALSEPVPAREEAMLVHRLVLLVGAAMTGPLVVIIGLLTDTEPHLWWVVAASTVMAGLILVRMIGMVRQLTRQAGRLSALADTDFVTGLANRRGFVVRLDEHFADADADADAVVGTEPGALRSPDAGVLLVDIERFSDLSDSLGHGVGDALVGAVGRRLHALHGADSVVARIGEGTFAVLCREGGGARAPAFGLDWDDRALVIRAAVEDTYELRGLSLSVEVCIGVVVLPTDAPSAGLALHRANVALVSARTRPGRITRYCSELETGGTFAAQLVSELLVAMNRGEIVLHYQPQVEISTGRVFGVEALARWEHPVHGLLGPDAFIPATEQTGLIGPFTRHVLDRAVAQCARWHADGLNLTVAVNLSARNLLDPELLHDVRAALAQHGLPASALELEITEGTAMVDPTRSLQVLGALADLGIMLSIDDYGTGHSSLAYLQRLPVGRLKIDRSFVTDLVRDEASATIVRSTIDLARHLRLDVIAEGVEEDATLSMLRDMDCHAVQGFGLGRPVPPDEVPALVRQIEQRLAVLPTPRREFGLQPVRASVRVERAG